MANDIGRSAHRDRFIATSVAHRSPEPGATDALSLRRCIALVAALTMLLHAGFLVRHNAVMLEATREQHALIADLASLCRTGHGADHTTPADLPSVPWPLDTSGCPVCAGLVAAFALLHAAPAVMDIAYEPADVTITPEPGAPVALTTAHPPARAPPVRA